MPQFASQSRIVLGDALKEGARDILVKAKTKAPFEKGRLRADSEIKRNNALSWRISFWSEYARFQEFGGDAKRRVRNYTTPGTGKKFLKSSGDEVAKVIKMKFKKHARRVR